MKNSQIKVCHMTSVHKRYDARILKKECCTLVANGYDVTLIVADNKPEEIYNGVKIVSINFTPKNRLDRIKNSKKYILKEAVGIDADIYHFHDPELIPVGLDLLKRGKKVIYDSHENYPQDIFYKKIWMPLPLRWIVSKAFAVYEKTALPKFSAVISVTPQIVDRFLLSNKNSYLITNYPIIKGDDECSVKIRTNNKWIAVFAGSIQAPWVHENFIKAIQDTSFSFIMAGKVSEPAYIEKLKSLDRNNKLTYIGEKTQDEIFALYKDVSLGLAIAEYRPTEFNHEGSLGINKFFEYMRFGIPSICTDYTLWMPIIEKWRCSFPVNPNKLDDIIQVLHKIENNPDLLVEMGRRAREASVTEYNWESQVPTLLKAYKAAMQ